jgi:hypothetical protein
LANECAGDVAELCGEVGVDVENVHLTESRGRARIVARRRFIANRIARLIRIGARRPGSLGGVSCNRSVLSEQIVDVG